MTFTIKEDAINVLTDLVVTLVVEHGVKHNVIIQHIRDALTQASKSHVPVMLNKINGIFGLSKDFQEYCKDSANLSMGAEDFSRFDRRVEITKLVRRYGERIIKVYPEIQLVLKLAGEIKLKQIFIKARTIYKRHNYIDIASEPTSILDKLENDEVWKVVPQCVKDSASAYLSLCNEIRERVRQRLFQDENDDEHGPFINMAFMDAFKCFHDDDLIDKLIVWDVQSFVDKHVARFCQYLVIENNEEVLNWLLHKDVVSDEPDMIVDDCVSVGLLAASGSYARLEIESVPCLIDWTLMSDNGREMLV